MLHIRFVVLFVFVIGITVLSACGSQTTTTVASTAMPTTEPPTATIFAPTEVVAIEESVAQAAEGQNQLGEMENQPPDTPLPVVSETKESPNTPAPTPAPEIIACNGTLTPAQTEGPYYTPNTPERTSLVEPGMGGVPLLVMGKVLNQNCEPLAGMMLDFWQTDEHGAYDNVGYRMRGHQFTDENGTYTLETILPERYPGRTPHIHVKLFASDGQEMLTTQIYIPGISDQVPDGIFRPDLLATDLESEPDGRQHVAFDFVVGN